MGKTTIGWTDYTFNPWWGCTKVSPGCKHCYAEAFDKRVGGDHWGPGQPRRTMSDGYWKAPLAWDKKAAAEGVRRRVFCASMADVFDPEAPDYQLARLWNLITDTPNLDWLLLTKRPDRMCAFFTQAWPNVWLGTSVEDQKRADERIPHLLATPAAVRFLSCEPLLGPVDLGAYVRGAVWNAESDAAIARGGTLGRALTWTREHAAYIDWVIVGGESGPEHRPMDVAWLTGIVRQAMDGGTAVFVKQDSGMYPEKQGRIPDDVWALKAWPR